MSKPAEKHRPNFPPRLNVKGVRLKIEFETIHDWPKDWRLRTDTKASAKKR